MRSPFEKQAQAKCGITNYVMRYLLILCATLVVTSVQKNKIVNVIVNLDPREVAEELWKVMEARLSNGTSHITSSKSAIRDLKNTVQPILSSSRRDGTLPSAFQVAGQFDQITRRALTRDTSTINSLDEEILTRDIVADMMFCLKIKTMRSPVTINSDEQEDYVNIKIKINKNNLINVLN
nr:PREDICTED: LOW QUALITY PROTEIN: uncharacterized protein LOC105670686 [Linepithema humile]